MTVVGDAIALARKMADETGTHLVVHQRFNTATVSGESWSVDLVTARRETYPTPAARPVVEVGNLADARCLT